MVVTVYGLFDKTFIACLHSGLWLIFYISCSRSGTTIPPRNSGSFYWGMVCRGPIWLLDRSIAIGLSLLLVLFSRQN